MHRHAKNAVNMRVVFSQRALHDYILDSTLFAGAGIPNHPPSMKTELHLTFCSTRKDDSRQKPHLSTVSNAERDGKMALELLGDPLAVSPDSGIVRSRPRRGRAKMAHDEEAQVPTFSKTKEKGFVLTEQGLNQP